MYKFIVSYDIQDNKGKSLLQKDIANAIALPMTEDDFNNFIYGLARLRLETFAGHLYACCLQANRKKTLDKDALVSNYNYVIEFPRNLSAIWDYQHSRVVTLGTGDPYITLKEDAVKSRAFGLYDEYDANNLNSPPPTIRQILGLDP